MKYFVKKQNYGIIEPEEILLDKSSSEKLDDSRLELPIKESVFIYFFLLIILVFVVFFGRSIYLQVLEHEKYAEIAENNKTRSYPVLANRGVIYDRSMQQLVFNVPGFDLVIVPANMSKKRLEREIELIKISGTFGLNKEEILIRFKEVDFYSVEPILLKGGISRDEALFIESKISEFEGVELKKHSIRGYKDGMRFAHLVGYTGKVSGDDLTTGKNLSSLDFIGKSGLELMYDDLLRGVNGRVVLYIDSVSRIKKERKVKDESSGNNVVLAIDSELQNKVYEELKKQVEQIEEAEGGAAVAINPKTGEVLALVSYPSYNNNTFSRGGSEKEYNELFSDELNPLFNRAILGSYPAGSALKPFIALAALEENVINENTKINDIGYISIQNIYNPEIVYTFRDWKEGGHGIIDIKEALAVSSNVFFYTIGGGHENIEGLGIERIKKYLNFFGFGNVTGIDLVSEDAGLVPDPEWKKINKGENWYVGDTYISSIGQGNVLVTPIQLAMATAAIANNGKLFEPQIVKEILNKEGMVQGKAKPILRKQGFLSEENLKTVKEGMRMSITEGSAYKLRDLPIKVAGKTGTAQIGGDDTHAWFTSFAPYEDPEIVLTILVEKGGEGSAAAVPIAKEVYKHYFNIQDPKEGVEL